MDVLWRLASPTTFPEELHSTALFAIPPLPLQPPHYTVDSGAQIFKLLNF